MNGNVEGKCANCGKWRRLYWVVVAGARAQLCIICTAGKRSKDRQSNS